MNRGLEKAVRILMLGLASVIALCAQSLSNATLTGKYFVHHMIRVVANGVATDQRSLSGVLLFDGVGAYTFTGTRKIGAGVAEIFNSSGTYGVNAIGVVSLSNLQGAGAAVNARYSQLAVVGSSTEATAGTFDLLVAIPAPPTITLPSVFDGVYRTVALEFEGDVARATYFTASVGSLTFAAPLVKGIASNRTGVQQSVFAASPITISSDGLGRVQIASGLNQLYGGNKTVYGSRDGNMLLLAPEAAGTHGLTIALKMVTPASNATLSGLYWTAGLRQDGARAGTFTGTMNSVGNGVALVSRRACEVEGVTDFTGRSDYTVDTSGAGTVLGQYLTVGVGGNAFATSSGAGDDPNNFELSLGVRVPPVVSASGPFLNPYGVVNTASFAPPVNPVAPGQYVDLYGSGLATGSVIATAPFPVRSGGVQVLVNDTPAPIYIVTPGLVKILIPQATAAGAAAVTVVVNGVRSNTIPIVVARTAPGVFSATQNGIGTGAILRADNSLMTQANAARHGETIQVFLNGLGAVSPPVADGVAAPLTALSLVKANVRVYVRGVAADVSFKGLAPGIVSLNQLNVVIPASIPAGAWPLAVETDDGFTDQVDVIVAP